MSAITPISLARVNTGKSARSQVGPEMPSDVDLQIRYRTLTFQHDDLPKKDGKKLKDPAEAIREIDVHLLRIEDVYTRYSTHPKIGLEKSAVTRKSKDAKNKISPAPPQYWKQILQYVFGGFNFLLWVAGIVTLLSWRPLGDPAPQAVNLGVAILIFTIIFVSAGFYAFVDWNASRIMKSIQSLMAESATVLRDGIRQDIPAIDVVVGDVVCLSLGQRVPADLRIVDMTSDLKFDRSLMTGESDPISASLTPTDTNPLQTHNLALSSTFVAQGAGAGVVFAIGDNTVMGRIVTMSAKQKTKMTTLQKEINYFTVIITLVAATMFTAAMLTWTFWLRHSYPNYMTLPGAMLNAIGCLTAFVPQGLPICMALSLTVIARRMAARKVLVKNLSTIETLGCMSVLCTDKTGTLTMAKMSVVSVAFGDVDMIETEKRPITTLVTKYTAAQDVRLAALLCNGASFTADSMHLPIADRSVKGDSTDISILRFGEHLGSISELASTHEKLFEIPFNSKNKWMLVVSRVKGESIATVLVKGAPDRMVEACTYVVNSDSSVSVIDIGVRRAIEATQEKWSSEGQRVLALCRRDIPIKDLPTDPNKMESYCYQLINDLVLVALVGIRDPPRPDVRDSIEKMRLAGVRVFMTTGDFKLTAVAIARQVAIVTAEHISTFADVRSNTLEMTRCAKLNLHDMKPNDDESPRAITISGNDMTDITDDEWNVIFTNYSEIVFSRTTPEQKLRIVNEAKRRGDNTVAVTGDGVNDGPALKAADIGVAMGSGSDVSKEAAAMILLNDDFSSILVAIENGRLVFDNLKKVIMYLMPLGSYTEFMAVAANFYVGVQSPLSAYLQVIFCVSNDVAMSMSLMYEPPESDLMSRKPRNARTDRLTDLAFFLQIYAFIGLMAWPVCMYLFFSYLGDQGIGFMDVFFVFDQWGAIGATANFSADQLASFLSIAQCCYASGQVGLNVLIVLAVRCRKVSIFQSNPFWGPSRNPVLIYSIIATYSIAIINFYGPGIQTIFGTAVIPVKYWFLPLAFGVGILAMDEIRKLIVRSYPKSFIARIAW
ncbi:hypothetical protein BASA50_004195 [Batrachochytrium salamandrivorans]|uniref:Cation-transporting P-type ATPase N-terminal domain-containing protein n=1 Tax=Batrachochytrium salamandrivorans TaxID=1357716 RepID=A0ABQ8FGC6_9FUNG|nr:hypothetical protein BASA62_009404 [Batrachochytrium salamandrivorans]KAH6568343.1 hypothetical protein BASA60_008646 [Batrachochytrium salamandrivorans]KAH6597851.1 hypothetical protein BASA50_004195 [Batrachochytrium salamandrivorans]KAH6598794.1 hypothetical protein BASA61_002780 [Batrachochytrium salamandrivorans]KAH9269370.1 hypothetical protein BASA83_008596 [Batrachochytrium salamandrivorans]